MFCLKKLLKNIFAASVVCVAVSNSVYAAEEYVSDEFYEESLAGEFLGNETLTDSEPEEKELENKIDENEAEKAIANDEPEILGKSSAAGSVMNLTPAVKAVSSGKCGDNLNYNITIESYDEEEEEARIKMVISGTGPMYDYSNKTDGWTHPDWETFFEEFESEYDVEYAAKVVFEEGITRIGNYAFSDTAGGEINLGEIQFPQSLVEIGDYAFYESYSLRGKLVFPAGLKKIGKSAFEDCDQIKGVLEFPQALEEIGDKAFSGCDELKNEVIFNEGLKKIGSGAFYSCDGLRGKLTLPSTLEYIGDEAFCYDEAFNGDIVIPDSCAEIGNKAFYEFAKSGIAGSLTLGKKLKRIGNEAFKGANIKGELVFPEGLQEIGEEAFCKAKITGDLRIPDSVAEIGKNAFFECEKLDGTLTLGNGLKVIPEGAFRMCEKLQGDLRIPDSVEIIEPRALGGLLSMKGTLSLGKNLKRIESNAFYNDAFIGELVLPEGLEYIGDSAFFDCIGFTSVVLPDSIKVIETTAFEYCENMRGTLVLPARLSKLGAYAFAYTDFEGTVIVPESVESAGSCIFNECVKLDKIINNSKASVDVPGVKGYFWRDIGTNFAIGKIRKGTAIRVPEVFTSAFEIDGKNVNVNFYINGGYLTGDVAVQKGDAYILNKPEQKGCTFKGYYVEVNNKFKKITKIDSKTLKLIGDKVVYAQWKPNKYSVIFKLKSPVKGAKIRGKAKNRKIAFYDVLELPDDIWVFPKHGAAYKLAGWTLQEGDKENVLYEISMMGGYDKEHKKVVLYPVWEEIK